MKIVFPKLHQMALTALLVVPMVTLSGCIADDALNDDGSHYAAHSSDVYPLTKMRGRAQSCGNWPEDMTETSDNIAYTNHGCAVQANIATMVADQSTLTRPHAADLPMGAPAATAVRNVNATKSSGSGGGGLAALFGAP